MSITQTTISAFYDELEKLSSITLTKKERSGLKSSKRWGTAGGVSTVGGLGALAASHFMKPGKGARYTAGVGTLGILGGLLGSGVSRSKKHSVKKSLVRRLRKSQG